MTALPEERGRKSDEESEDDGGEVMAVMMNIAIIVRFSVVKIFRMIHLVERRVLERRHCCSFQLPSLLQ
jgi:hypothetical protein